MVLGPAFRETILPFNAHTFLEIYFRLFYIVELHETPNEMDKVPLAYQRCGYYCYDHYSQNRNHHYQEL